MLTTTGAFDMTPVFFAPAVSLIGGIVILCGCISTLKMTEDELSSTYGLMTLVVLIVFPLMAVGLKCAVGTFAAAPITGVDIETPIPTFIQSMFPDTEITRAYVTTGVGYTLTWVASICALFNLPALREWWINRNGTY